MLENSWFNEGLPYKILVPPTGLRTVNKFCILTFLYFIFFIFSQAIKECIHHATSLCEGVLRVGTLGWPLEVSASHMTQLQFASTVENVMETALHQV